MTIFNKIRWIVSILLVFAIVLTTNLIDKDNFNRLQYSINTIYEDRIVANDLIFDMILLIHEKEMALVRSDSFFSRNRNKEVNQDMGSLIARYEQTKFTDREELIFTRLKRDLQKAENTEKKYISLDYNMEYRSDLVQVINDVKLNLQGLSKIQLEEGRRQLLLSNETMKDIDFFTQAETIFLIVLAVLIQIIILYKSKEG